MPSFAINYNAILGVTKGDLLVGSTAGVTAKLGVGSDAQVLTADAASTNGVKWSTPAGASPGGSSGQVQFNNSSAFGGAAALTYSGSTPHVTITSQSAANVIQVNKLAASGSGDFIQHQNSSGTILANVNSSGNVNANSNFTAGTSSNPGSIYLTAPIGNTSGNAILFGAGITQWPNKYGTFGYADASSGQPFYWKVSTPPNPSYFTMSLCYRVNSLLSIGNGDPTSAYGIDANNNARAVSSSPSSGWIDSASGVGTNVAAGALYIGPGLSTGNAIPGRVVLQGTANGSSGTTLQTPSDVLTITNSTTITLNDGVNINLNATTGTKWGRSTDKQSWWGATPVVQQVLATGASHTVDDVITLLQTLGLCKQS